MDTPTKNKARYWVGVLYNENMRDDWEDTISELLQYPYCYCIHDKDYVDSEEHRKVHTHIMIAFPNTTTYKNALSIFHKLDKNGCMAINTCESVISVKYMYDYLIHNTDNAKKKGKFLYPVNERITGNNFDIGDYVQLSSKDKQNILFNLLKVIKDNDIYNFVDFMDFITCDFSDIDDEVFEVVKTNNGFLERMIKGNYLKHCAK